LIFSRRDFVGFGFAKGLARLEPSWVEETVFVAMSG
jgi:hypothetical protein